MAPKLTDFLESFKRKHTSCYISTTGGTAGTEYLRKEKLLLGVMLIPFCYKINMKVAAPPLHY